MKKGWEIKKLGEIGKVSMCKRVFKEDTTPEGDIPFYKIGTFGKTPDAFITKEKYNEFRNKFSFPKKGDILISASGTIGRRVRYDGEPAYFQDSNIVWIDNNEKLVLNDYLYRFYEICNWGASKGATISRLYNDNLKQIEIPFPKSLPEQQHIVSILDEAFAAIGKAKANAEQNLKNAKELFESYLQGVFEKKGNGWEEKKLSDICELISGQHIDSKEYNLEEKGIGYLTGPSDFGDLFPIVTKWTEFPKRTALRGDILITVKGSGVGKVNLMVEDELCISRQLMGIRSKKVDTSLLYAFIKTKQKYFQSLSNGAAIPGISRGDVLNMKIYLPSLEEQQLLIRQLNILQTQTKKLKTVYQKKIADLEELKKSILQKAFAGELKTEREVAI